MYTFVSFISALRWLPTSRFTSTILIVLGNGGSNENTNGLLRQYFPKGTDLADHSQATLNEVARQLVVSFRCRGTQKSTVDSTDRRNNRPKAVALASGAVDMLPLLNPPQLLLFYLRVANGQNCENASHCPFILKLLFHRLGLVAPNGKNETARGVYSAAPKALCALEPKQMNRHAND